MRELASLAGYFSHQSYVLIERPLRHSFHDETFAYRFGY
jgi:hypothetical protein